MRGDLLPLLVLLASALAVVGGVALTATGGGYGIVLAAAGIAALVLCVRALVRSLREHQIRLLAPHDDLSDKPSH
ncbi:hypothetical protein GCM10027515_11220 [Schumannella luteola]|uniref:Lysylphosphatidylglycerol synthetase-like protein (DUF2156 family) n=1 Tax=Schumannella luteola TaxID=472059 RepID=A0A852Y861_9MICO|nr:hypothetical protein [Schumannella luteola]NYG97570.1 lysylphosphatidylglycerol synthetase-like protein (DUF2156 family) [Schumannella luteola]TPX01581.1 hypothetical protein FJ656_26775 [Schumannella luteola]